MYWVCPLIEESEHLESEAAEPTAEALAEALPEVRVGLIHGRMATADKERVMKAFAAPFVSNNREPPERFTALPLVAAPVLANNRPFNWKGWKVKSLVTK